MVPNENFGWAAFQLKEGRAVRRNAWPAGRWICYMPPVSIDEGLVNGRTKKFVPNGPLNVEGYIAEMSPDNKWSTGWNPTATDLLSEDWGIY